MCLGKNRQGCGRGVPAELARRALEEHARRLHGQGWHGVGARANRIAGPRHARHPDFPIDLGIVGLQFSVGNGPVCQRGAGHGTKLARFNEIDGAKAPEVGRHVHAAPADQARVQQGPRADLGLLVGRLSPAHRRLVGDGVLEVVLELVVLELRRSHARTLLHHHNGKAARRQLLGHDPARRTRADDDKIDRGRDGKCDAALLCAHASTPPCSFGVVVAKGIRVRHGRFEAQQLPPHLIAVPAVRRIGEHSHNR